MLESNTPPDQLSSQSRARRILLMMLAGLALYYASQQFTDTPASPLPVKVDALDRI